MKTKFVDRKSWLTVVFFYLLNKVITRSKYKNFNVLGAEHIPCNGSFLLISNHTSRWDGLVLMETMKRSANWMVSPNELKGFQGLCLRSVGAFPADRRFELLNYVGGRIKKGEPIVIFPEGNIFKDGSTHPFKSGAARVLMTAREQGLELPVVSVAVHYIDEYSVNVVVSKPVLVDYKSLEQIEDRHEQIRSLTNNLHAKVSKERTQLEALEFGRLPVELERVAI